MALKGFTPRAVFSSGLKRSTEIFKDTRQRTARLVDTQTTKILNDASNAKKLLDAEIVKARGILNQGKMLGIDDRDTLKGWLALDEDTRKQYQKDVNTSRSLGEVTGIDRQQDFYEILGVKRPDISPAPGSNLFDLNETWIEQISKEYAGLIGGKTGANEQEQLSFKEEFSKNLKRNYGLGDVYSQAEERAIQLGGHSNKQYLDQLLYKSKRTPFVAPAGVVFKTPVDIGKTLNVQAAMYAAEIAEFDSTPIGELPVFKGQVNEQGNVHMPGLGYVPATTKHFELKAYWEQLNNFGKYYKDTAGKAFTSSTIRNYLTRFSQQSGKLMDVSFDTDRTTGIVLYDSQQPVTKIDDATNVGLNTSNVHTSYGDVIDEGDATRIANAAMKDMAVHTYIRSAYNEHLENSENLQDTVEEFNKFINNLSLDTQYGEANSSNRLVQYAKAWAQEGRSSLLIIGKEEGRMVIPAFDPKKGSEQLKTNKQIADMWIDNVPKAGQGASAGGVGELFPKNTPAENKTNSDREKDEEDDIVLQVKSRYAAALANLGPNPTDAQLQNAKNTVLADVMANNGRTVIASPDTTQGRDAVAADAADDVKAISAGLTEPGGLAGPGGGDSTTTTAPAPTTTAPAPLNLTDIFSVNAITKNYDTTSAAQTELIKRTVQTKEPEEISKLYKHIRANLSPEIQEQLPLAFEFKPVVRTLARNGELPSTNIQDIVIKVMEVLGTGGKAAAVGREAATGKEPSSVAAATLAVEKAEEAAAAGTEEQYRESLMGTSAERQQQLDLKARINKRERNLNRLYSSEQFKFHTGEYSDDTPRGLKTRRGGLQDKRREIMAKLYEQLTVDRDLNEKEQQIYDRLMGDNPLEYVDSLIKKGLGSKKK